MNEILRYKERTEGSFSERTTSTPGKRIVSSRVVFYGNGQVVLALSEVGPENYALLAYFSAPVNLSPSSGTPSSSMQLPPAPLPASPDFDAAGFQPRVVMSALFTAVGFSSFEAFKSVLGVSTSRPDSQRRQPNPEESGAKA